MSRQAKNQLPASPIEFRRADPDELAKFDPSTKICTMNCGQRSDDPRSSAECRLLCDDCQQASPKPPAPARDHIIGMAREAGVLTMLSGQIGWQEFSERFYGLATERERSARQAAQVENEELKSRLARAGIEQRKAVRKELQACAAICLARADGWDHAAPARDDTDGCMRHAAKNEARAIGSAILERIQ